MNHRVKNLWLGLAFGATVALGSCSDKDPDSGEAGVAPDGSLQQHLATSETGDSETGGRVSALPKGFFGSRGSFLSTFYVDKYLELCAGTDVNVEQCEVLRGLVVVETVLALREIAASRDQRGTAEALESLDIVDEPEILIAALQVLGRFPDTPGIAERTWPLLLESPYLEVQQMAARVLEANPEPTLAALGAYWSANHGTLYAENEYQEYPDFPTHYASMGFPDYPDAEWFSPADSDRSVGWWTTDDVPTVTAWLTGKLGAEDLSFQGWAERLSQESMSVFQSIDPAKQDEMERLTQKWVDTQDFAVLEELTKLQQELYAPVEAAGEMADLGVGALGPPNTTEALAQANFFIAEERGGRISRLIITYPLPSLGHTVIQHAWSLADYPGAWPPETNPSVE